MPNIFINRYTGVYIPKLLSICKNNLQQTVNYFYTNVVVIPQCLILIKNEIFLVFIT
jgi:hypothetical protein